VRHFVERHRDWLAARPSAFFSVSMAAASQNPEELAEIQRIMAAFAADSGWTPTTTESIAGALKFTEYNWLKRMIMKQIVKQHDGGATDTSRDYEYTDWKQVDGFAERFFGSLGGH
jgi:menaquinone-dependent protoporphyrinogen oxidase